MLATDIAYLLSGVTWSEISKAMRLDIRIISNKPNQ